MESRLGTGHDPALVEALSRREAEREVLLGRAAALLAADSRVTAAWVGGSVGRGDADALSDLDLHIVIDDDHIGAVTAHRRGYVTQVGEPLLLLEGPQNAPSGGAYLMALYDADAGVQQVDWAWHARCQAALPPATMLLLERDELPRSTEQPQWHFQHVPDRAPLEAAEHETNFFWAMLMIVAKQHARGDRASQLALLPRVLRSLGLVRRFVRHEPGPPDGQEPPLWPEGLVEISRLRDLAAEMEALMPQLAETGGDLPWSIVPAAHRYLDLAERITTGD